MGPAKGTRTITKIAIKGYEERRDEDPMSSSKIKLKKRKISDMLGPQWSKDELLCFYEAYRQYGKDWKKVGAAVPNRSADMVEALYSRNRAFLSLPEGQATAAGWIAMMTGHPNVVDGAQSNRESDQMVKASGKVQKRGDAKLQVDVQKVNEAPCPDHFNLKKSISGFSSSFKKSYYGDLVGNIRRRAVGKRTPRVPILFSADRNASDNGVSENKNSVNSSINAAEEINNTNRTSSGMNGLSTEGNLRSTKANKVVLHRDGTFWENKGIGHTDMSGSRQDLKKRRNEQSTREGHISNIKHEITTMAKEGNSTSDAQSLQERISDLFSPDEMLVLDVLQNLVNLPTKLPQPNINIDSGKFGKGKSKISDERERGHSPDDQSKVGKQIDECSAPKTRKKRKKLLEKEVSVEEENISSGNDLVSLQAQPVDTPECSSNSDPEGAVMNLSELTSHISGGSYLDMPTRHKPETNMPRRSKRKSRLRYRIKEACHDKQSLRGNESVNNSRERELSNCLSSELLRRWCAYEWFYSAVDYPWFMRNEFVEYLNHANLAHLPRLARSEWSTIRSSLGKPRRFSQHFLEKERKELEKYRVDVRNYYAAVHDGLIDGLPVDLVRPLSVGQPVIVRHPRTRELYDGKVLMVDHDRYMVQSDRPDFGIELVKDTDCMPANWSENLPGDFKKMSSFSNCVHKKLEIGHLLKHAPKESWDHNINGISMSMPSKSVRAILDELPKVMSEKSNINAGGIPSKLVSAAEQALYGQPYKSTQLQEKESAITNYGHVSGIKKLLPELGGNQQDGDKLGQLEHFKDRYEDVKQVHSAVDSARLCDNNTCDRHAPSPSLQSTDDTGQSRFDSSNYSDQDYELVSYVTAFVQSSISQAREMVDAAMQAISEIGIDLRAGEASTSRPAMNYETPKSQSGATDAQLPSKLILNCVATILAIKHLSEARHPPANIAGVLERATSMLRPSCSENFTIYREIENCISLIKNQMLALVPTSGNGNPATMLM